MYRSPIGVFYKQLKAEFDGNVVKAVQSYDINVDKDELIKALSYDRDQYSAGYQDGYTSGMDAIVRCRDCAYSNEDGTRCHYWVGRDTEPMGYCHKGVREGEGE